VSLKHFSIRTKLLLALGTLGILLIAAVSGGWLGTNAMYASIQTIYGERVVPLRDLKIVADLYAVNIVDASHKVRNYNLTWAEGLKGVEAAQAEIRERWATYAASTINGNEKALSARAQGLMDQADWAVERLVSILKAEDRAALEGFTINELYPAIEPVSEAVSKLVELQLEMAKGEADRAAQVFALLRFGFLVAAALALAALILAGSTIVRGVSRPLVRIANQMRALSRGDLDINATDADKRGAVGTLATALHVVKAALIAK